MYGAAASAQEAHDGLEDVAVGMYVSAHAAELVVVRQMAEAHLVHAPDVPVPGEQRLEMGEHLLPVGLRHEAQAEVVANGAAESEGEALAGHGEADALARVAPARGGDAGGEAEVAQAVEDGLAVPQFVALRCVGVASDDRVAARIDEAAVDIAPLGQRQQFPLEPRVGHEDHEVGLSPRLADGIG